MKTALRKPIAGLLTAGFLCLAAQPAPAATVTISPTPLATSAGGGVLPNLLFVLDASGSMDSDYLPDYVNDSGKCMTRSGPSTTCTIGDPPWSAGGASGFNGVGYDPLLPYKPALNAAGKMQVGNVTVTPAVWGPALTVTAVPNDAYGVQAGGTSNMTTGIQDLRYCNGNNVCKRNGADNVGTALIGGNDDQGVTHPAGRFPYRTHSSNNSTLIYGLPEMMSQGSFSRATNVVTATTIAPHALAVNDWIYVNDSGQGGIDLPAVQVASVPSTTSFTYTSTSSGTIAARQASYRKHSAATVARVAGSTTVTVTSTAHGLATNDIVLVNSAVNNTVNSIDRTVTVVNANTFTYTQTGGTTTVINTSPAATWIRTGLYNARGTVAGTANSFLVIPVEYCSDVNLSNCVAVAIGAAPPTGFTVPAPVRFCRTQEQALSPAVISDAAGTPRCRSKFVGSGATQWTWPRFGYFKRDIIQASSGPFTRSATRTDCIGAPSCTYTEEIQNYARWWAYYRTRMQMMKTASGRAFQPFINATGNSLLDKLKIGFITINPNYAIGGSTDLGSVQASRYLKIDRFTATHAGNWYTKFYAQDPNQSTPLREALSRAGWIFAGKLNTGLTSGIPLADDPMEKSCQRNFTLLTTDGYWNGNAGQDLSGNPIGNLDNANPVTDSPYSSPSVDRSSTGTFDGGIGTIVATATPTTQLEQVICQAGNTTAFNGGNQTACGCAAGQHRIKQRTNTSTNTITTTDGVQTGNTTTTTSTFQNITGCSSLYVITQTTPANRIQDQVCSGNATVNFGQGATVACGCTTPTTFKRVVRQTGNRNHVVQNTDGSVTSDTYTAYVYSTQNASACNAAVNTVVTEMTEIEDNRCTGTGSTTFGTSANNGQGGEQLNCGCGSGVRRNWRRTMTYDRTVIQHDGATVSTTYGANKSQTFTALTGCTSPSAPSSTPSINASAPQPPTYPQVTNSGATVTLASNTLSPPAVTPGALTPNPQVNDPSGAMVPSTAGTDLAPTLAAFTPNPSNPVVGTATTTTTLGGYPNTLADVAMYYFRSDLRGGNDIRGNTAGPTNNLGGGGTVDVSPNTILAKAGAKDFATHQHMVTFAVGLADGLMRYQADYEGAASGDFASIKNGTSNGCFWVTGTCNWPQPFADDASALDDLWHAAVNGRGQFYLALNADTLSTGIATALTAVNAQEAAAAASATSSPNVTQTDNQIFSTTYETNTWSGKVFAQTIDPITGDVNQTIAWQADQQLITKVSAASDTRVIWTFDGTSGTKLKAFSWAGLTATEQAFFLNKCVPTTTMAQCTALTTAQLATANDGSSLVGFLRGWLGNEGTIFRDRTYIDISNNNAVVQTVLGDTISARPSYLRRPTFNYADAVTPPYSQFLTDNINRSPRVYVAANDGYLHAFNGDTGSEAWAYLPRFLMPGLWGLADTGYASQHRYYADGSPETGDVFDTTASAWKTILVAGVAGGGRGFYAIDVTDPNNPKGLWEFCSDSTLCAVSDADLGLSYGNPVIGKRARDGRWIVMVTSGLNNIGTGTGLGYFYILDAITGAVLDKVATTAGSVATPSGLMKVSAFYDSALTDATFRYAYGGDQLGNIWRIDTLPNPPTVLHIATLNDGSTPPRAQPITTRPSLTRLNGNRVLYVGTGRYLGNPDLSDPGAPSGISWQQTLYAFKDKDSDYGNLRLDTNMVRQALTMLNPTDRGITTSTVDWNTKDGWYIDFNPSFSGVPNTPGEGVNLIDPRLVLGTLVVITNTPASGGSSCSVGGSSIKYEFDFKTGGAVSTSQGGVVGKSLGGTITVGVAIVQLPSGAIKAITTGADTSKTTSSVNTSATGAAVRRFSYRVR
ncbi:MAG: type pilus assembly protein PilY1 [Betaproteobacteria bacterium]|nr:type pilus assembly protein PilY1 [Betaproteobacteria bacterium]